MPEKLARSVVVTPCCRHHSLTERPLLRHSWICVAHSCSSARCFNSALVILTPHNTTVAKPFATFRYYCLMCVYARLGLTVTLQLPNSEEFDVDTTLTLTRRQTKETLALLSAYPERYRWIQPHTTFDYISPKDPKMYDLRFRVVRFRISGGCYETVYTNLDSETFPIGKIKELYRLRWGIETSFRELKYTIGLSCLHGKKTDFLLQEVFARLILYNYASLIARKIPVPQEKQINFSTAILVCKQFLKGKIRSAQIFGILSKHLSPIRPGRQYKRYQNPVSAVAFQYRFS